MQWLIFTVIKNNLILSAVYQYSCTFPKIKINLTITEQTQTQQINANGNIIPCHHGII